MGGVGYRALNALFWIIARYSIVFLPSIRVLILADKKYHFVTQAIAFTVIAPYISTPRWKRNFELPIERQAAGPVWYVLYQLPPSFLVYRYNQVFDFLMHLYTGMPLDDTSTTTFQTAYLMLLLMAFLILAGNTASVS